MTPEEFERRWRALPSPSSVTELEASEVVAGSGVWIARDHPGHPHLLVRVPDGVRLDVAATHGLSAAVTRHRIPAQPDATYIDLVGLEPDAPATFAAVAVDIVAEVATCEAVERRSLVIATLNKWRWFWGADPARLSATDAVGLFGELWFLIRWAGVSPDSVRAWGASKGARHDFQWPDRSVEVKATSRAGPVMHTIQHLDQLADPETGQLYLYSVRVARDALAANTLDKLVDTARAALGGQAEVRADLLAKLGQRGYNPGNRDHSAVPYRVIDEGLYTVTGEFPRLTRECFSDGLPVGVAEVSYSIDMDACTQWRVARDPSGWPP